MGRKKSRSVHSCGISEVPSKSSNKPDRENAKHESEDEDNDCETHDNGKPFYVEVDSSSWNSDDHYNIAELFLDVIDSADEETQIRFCEDYGGKPHPTLRFSLYGADESSFKLGHWPVLPADCVVLEGVSVEKETKKDIIPFFSGIFDGPDEGVSGLAHLVSLKLVTLGVVGEVGKSFIISSVKLRVGILRSTFEACNALYETVRQPWRKSMMNAMSWLRPDAVNSEAIYRIRRSEVGVFYEDQETTRTAGPRKHALFDASGFYEAIKPSKDEPKLECELPDLLPHLRPYQKRAAYWMVQREKGAVDSSNISIQDSPMGPFSVPVKLLEEDARLFYNPFNGNISLLPEYSSLYVSGGILADEMGLGKTVELLACILTHPRLSLQDSVVPEDDAQDMRSQIKRQKQERVECICGAANENSRYKGLWVQCDICDAWQHADCVGYSPKKKSSISWGLDKRRGSKSAHHVAKEVSNIIVESDESYVCSLCSELLEAVKSNTSTAATLIVCPAPILAQWQSEISRHTRPGSLKICIYEGARNLTSSITLRNKMKELETSDIVLTTYDVLKEDLSHDSDRHDGDRRFMRFQKKYPVIPTLLTRIHWWRLCLDEAQMVECNTASVTEMAMRLSAQHRWCITGTPIQRKMDDMYGLLRFLRASPFDVYRWWVDVIRDPYERRDLVAMEFVHRFFKKIMWRSSKVHVSDELQLPSQEECLSWLTFSPVEEHFYQKQHATCVRYAHQIIRSCKNDICERKNSESPETSCNNSLSHNNVEKLLVSLLKLRQACCHPQVGSSGLCSLQRSPLTMEEILDVLIGRTKIEGEEALRIIVVALNGLAGIAIIEKDNNRAISLYKEALALADENCNDFRLDPLLSIHILHNLAELLPVTSELVHQCPLVVQHSSENNENRKTGSAGRFARYYVKRRKICYDGKSDSNASGRSLEQDENLDVTYHLSTVGDCGDRVAKYENNHQEFIRCYYVGCLKKTCETIKQKYLSLFVSKLSLAQQEFRNSYMQVCSIYKECKNQNMNWWLHALDVIEENKDTSELLKKIDNAMSSFAADSRPVKISSRIRNIAGLKYTIQIGLDALETSRQAVINRILEIDQTMENPNIVDIERKRYCPNCNNGNSSLCISCELDQLFQIYETGLFLLQKAKSGVVIAFEDAIKMQRQKAALNHFLCDSEMSLKDNTGGEKNKQRNVREDIQVSKNPSLLEITLEVIKSFSKKILGKEGVASARKHLLLFEAMRKEYSQARCLSVAQSQFLGAHDEIRMSTTRMRLKETEDEPTSITVLSREELISHSLQYSSDKFLSFNSLARIKGQLRYLKGLVVSNQKVQNRQLLSASKPRVTAELSNSSLAIKDREGVPNTDEELCPVCHEKLGTTKMVFPCGHILCCKCCLKITEKANVQFGKCQQKWIMCPTCRQHTDPETIAYVDERSDNCGSPRTSHAFQAENLPEKSIAVKGSYGTKIEAVTRRILWITSTGEEAKVLVFSSWNDVLDVLSHSLDANNVTYVRMKGGRKSQDAIAKFKGLKNDMQGDNKSDERLSKSKSKSISVLLMLIQHGANGLNILEAQHVILVEPLLNPAVEAQAISRVHRVGQEKKTFVHRFLVKDSVEESIYKLNRSRNVNSRITTKAKKKNEPVLTIQDVESLFPMNASSELHCKDGDVSEGSLRHLPPAVASGLAAERRLVESRNNSTNLE